MSEAQELFTTIFKSGFINGCITFASVMLLSMAIGGGIKYIEKVALK